MLQEHMIDFVLFQKNIIIWTNGVEGMRQNWQMEKSNKNGQVNWLIKFRFIVKRRKACKIFVK